MAKTNSSTKPASAPTQIDPDRDPVQRAASARSWLKIAGWYPTPKGEKWCRRYRKSFTQDVITALKKMDTPDIFALWIVTNRFTWKPPKPRKA